MKNKFVFLIIFLVVAVGLVALWFHIVETVPQFEGKINFAISERFNKQFDGPHLYLSVVTERYFAHLGYGIEHSVIIRENIIKVTLGEIIPPEGPIFLPALGPAGFSKRLNLQEGSYTLEFHSRQHIDKYLIKVSKNTIIIKPTEKAFSKPRQTTIKKIPENILEATCYYNGDWKYDPRDDFCERFFDEIEKIAQLYLAAEKGSQSENQFYLYTGEDQLLIDLLLEYNRRNFFVTIITWEGRSYSTSHHIYLISRPTVAAVPKIEIEYLEKLIMDVEKCEKNDIRYIIRVAFYTKNAEICRQLPLENQGGCLWQVGIAKLDPSLCKYAGRCFTCLQECYTFIAIQTSNPNLCKGMINILDNLYRDECFYLYAKEKEDKSICHRISAHKPAKIKSCLENISNSKSY